MIDRSSAEWVFLLNPDAWPEPGAIGTLVTVATSHPRAAAIAPKLEYPDGRLQHSTHPFPSVRLSALTALWWNRLSTERADALLLDGAWKHDRPRRVDWAIGAALLMRRRAIEEVGPLDERYFMYVEDLEWCWRAHQHGWEIRFEPQAVVRHVANVSGRKRYGYLRTRTHVHNAVRFYRDTHSLPSTIGWWSLELLGSSRRYVRARLDGDAHRTARWRNEASAYLRALLPSQSVDGRGEGVDA